MDIKKEAGGEIEIFICSHLKIHTEFSCSHISIFHPNPYHLIPIT